MIIFLADSITKPLQILAHATRDIAKGKWDVELPKLKSTDEVGDLAASFLYMKEALKKHIEELTKTTAAKERMESELKIAHDIQMGIVPKVFPAFPDRREFDLYAALEPAREIGGDFYDFFFIDENRLCFVIGDVSGKGVPAALFMAVTKTLIKANAKETTNPDEILRRVNVEIFKDNESCMFVTVLCGVWDVTANEIWYANAGHNPPLLVRKGQRAEFLTGEHGPALGALQNGSYIKQSLLLDEGDVLCLYTDGITEACNENEELFSEERLQKLLSNDSDMPLKELVENTLRKIHAFEGARPQSDDITLLMLRYLGDSETSPQPVTLVMENDLSSLSKLTSEIMKFGRQHRLRDSVLHDINLVLEEVIVNVISYAYADRTKHEISIRLSKEKKTVALQIRDDGKPFNPLQIEAPDLRAPIKERPVGGLGIHLVRNLTQSMEYERKGSWNILTLKMAV